jgi:hypothetical protein
MEIVGLLEFVFQFCVVITLAIIHKKNYLKSGNYGTFFSQIPFVWVTLNICFAKLRKFAQNKINGWTPISFDMKNNISTSWVLHMGVTYDIWLNSVNWWISFFHGGSWEDGMGYMLVFIYLEP